MSTNSTISIQNQDGTIDSIYCHWDGYLEWNGKILFQNFNTEEKVRELISGGDLSSLYMNVNPTIETHSYENPEKDVCIYYGRDRGEKDIEFKTFAAANALPLQEFNYLFMNGVWHLFCFGTGKFSVLLEDALRNETII